MREKDLSGLTPGQRILTAFGQALKKQGGSLHITACRNGYTVKEWVGVADEQYWVFDSPKKLGEFVEKRFRKAK